MPHPPVSSRLVATQLIAQWLVDSAFPNRLITSITKDRAFVMELVYGVVRWLRSLEWMLNRIMVRSPSTKLKASLLTGLYQIVHLPDIAPYAVVNETVDIARHLAGPHTAKAANAILRRALREKDLLLTAIQKESMGTRFSHPDILLDRWIREHGEKNTEDLCAWNNKRPTVILRIRTALVRFDLFIRHLEDLGITYRVIPMRADECVEIDHGVRVENLPGYTDGWFTVQDTSTLLAPTLLAPRDHERILDACAAPGGKTIMLADLMHTPRYLVAADIYGDRLNLLRANLQRTGLANLAVIQGDIRDQTSFCAALRATGQPQQFDAILLDVPCTNTGVLRRRADARWRFNIERMQQILRTQKAILEGASQRVRPGGRIVYSTCSLEPEENRIQIKEWIRTHPDFVCTEEHALFPPLNGTDGAYAALLHHRGK